MSRSWICEKGHKNDLSEETCYLCGGASTVEVKEVKPIEKIGGKPKWRDSSGRMYSEEQVRRKRSAAYGLMDATRAMQGGSIYVCDAYNMRMSIVDHDHTVSQQRCKELGKTELIWDPANIEYSSRQAHMEWESYKSGEFHKHKNFERRMAFMKENDYEGYVKRMEVVELFNRPKQTI